MSHIRQRVRADEDVVDFQYPTTGRGLCHTIAAVVLPIVAVLSIPYHGSWAVSRDGDRRRARLMEPFNTLPRVVGCVTARPQQQRRQSELPFQYPTTGRGLCHTGSSSPSRRSSVVFQYPTTGRGLCHYYRVAAAVEGAVPFNTLPRVVGCVTARGTPRSLSALPGPSFNTLPRVVGCVTRPPCSCAHAIGAIFQYPTTGRGLCHMRGRGRGRDVRPPFNTLPRVVGCVTRTATRRL